LEVTAKDKFGFAQADRTMILKQGDGVFNFEKENEN
jgi:hypothetical protein